MFCEAVIRHLSPFFRSLTLSSFGVPLLPLFPFIFTLPFSHFLFFVVIIFILFLSTLMFASWLVLPLRSHIMSF